MPGFPIPFKALFQAATRLLGAILIIGLWTGFNPFLRFWVYSHWDLQSFIKLMDSISLGILILQILGLWLLLRNFGGRQQLEWSGKIGPIVSALCILPVLWLGISLTLYIITEFHLLEDAGFGPLYDSHFFVRQNPLSLTSLAFFTSAILEEIFYRSWLPDFLQRFFRTSVAILLSASLFTFAHASPHTGALALLAIFLVALGFHYVRSNYGLTAVIVLHLLNNTVVFVGAVFSFQIFKFLADHKWAMYGFLLIALVGAGFIIRDFRKLLNKGPTGPYDHSLPRILL